MAKNIESKVRGPAAAAATVGKRMAEKTTDRDTQKAPKEPKKDPKKEPKKDPKKDPKKEPKDPPVRLPDEYMGMPTTPEEALEELARERNMQRGERAARENMGRLGFKKGGLVTPRGQGKVMRPRKARMC